MIKNLYINRPSTDYIGLFGCLERNGNGIYAQIHNLGLSGTQMSVVGNHYVGAMAGYATHSIISNTYNMGSIS